MGGNGVWDLAANSEELFAAAVSIAGWFHIKQLHKSPHMPVWAFHGERDDVVPFSNSEILIKNMEELGFSPKFTSYPDLDHGHEVMRKTYTNPELYGWLEGHRKISKERSE